jgi:hypothetical protein
VTSFEARNPLLAGMPLAKMGPLTLTEGTHLLVD